jgi:hypothetical protein
MYGGTRMDELVPTNEFRLKRCIELSGSASSGIVKL